MGVPISEVIQPGPAHFAMVEKEALYNLDALMQEDVNAARLIVSLVRLMEPGTGGVVVISRQAIKEVLGVSMPTVDRAVKTLISGRWVHRIRIGGAYAFAVNENVAWVGPRGQVAHAVFRATVVASREEQDEAGLNVERLRQIPMARLGESILAVGKEPEPPAQRPLDGMPPVVAIQSDHMVQLEARGQLRMKEIE